MILLVVVAISGLVLQIQGFLDNDEQAKEQLAEMKSSVTVEDLRTKINLEAALAALTSRTGNVHLKKLELDFRSEPSTLIFFTEEPSPREIRMETQNYKIILEKEAGDNNFWIKLHSGEIVGDAGRVLGISGGLVLLFLTVSGCWIYFQMYRRRPSTHSFWKRLFW